MSERDPYAIVGVPVHVSTDAVTAVCRDLARRYHPDVSTVPDAERRMAEINAACTILRDPVRRAAWDRANLRVAGPADETYGFRGTAAAPRAASGRETGQAAPKPDAGQARAQHPGRGPVAWRRGPLGEGAAGPPPGPRRGSVLPFGRHIGWSLGEIARVDHGYLAWLRDRREGEPYRAEINALLDGMQPPTTPQGAQGRRRRGPFG